MNQQQNIFHTISMTFFTKEKKMDIPKMRMYLYRNIFDIGESALYNRIK